MNATHELVAMNDHPVATMPQAVTPMTMLQLAVQQGADLDRLQKLMDLQERWEKNEARKAFHAAFAAFKSSAVSIIKNKPVNDGPLKGKSYADLFAVVDAITPALSANSLTASWRLTKDEKDWLEVTCTLTHTLGHSESVSMGGSPDTGGAKNAIQARASTISYLERYTLLAATGLAARDMDKDGNAPAKTVEPDPEGKKKLEACASLSSLQEAWKALTVEQRKTLSAVKEECKARIVKADAQS